ncbi:TetR family transcriptional regulator, partial [Mycobacterium sp. ITM-2017-0098]
MDVVSRRKSAESLTVRKQRATKTRIAAAAAQAVTDHGLAGATVERIAAAAEVGRATFFRYFSAKEDAVAEGMTG